MKENTLLLRRNSVQNLFNGYYYDSTIAAIAGSKLSAITQGKKDEGNNKAAGNKYFCQKIINDNYLIIYLEDPKKNPKNVNTSEITTKDHTSKP